MTRNVWAEAYMWRMEGKKEICRSNALHLNWAFEKGSLASLFQMQSSLHLLALFSVRFPSLINPLLWPRGH